MSGPQDRDYRTQNFGLVLFLVGKGYTPMRAQMSRDGSAKVEYVFSPASRDDVDVYYQVKEVLNQMSVEARRSVDPNPTRTAGDLRERLGQPHQQ